jgi:glycosyltransferase involved in cell wall biosynthesis
MVIHYPFFGGPHNQALRLNYPLERLGVSTTVVLPGEPGNAAGRLRSAGLDVAEIGLHRIRARVDPRFHVRLIAGFFRDVQRLRALIRERSVDVVEINGLVNAQGAVAARLEGVPVIWQLLDTRAPRPVKWLLMPLVRRLANVVMSTGYGVADVHPGARSFGDRLVPFYPPVDTATFRPGADRRAAARLELGLEFDAPVIGCVANITRQKGIEHFVAMAERVASRRPDAHFVLLGRVMETQQDYAEKVLSLARRLTDEGRLVIRDPGSRVGELLPAFDIFVMTSVSRSEGISTTVLEAMACGLPVVATDVGALNEVVAEGVTGRLVQPADIEAMVQAVVELLNDPERLTRAASEARSRAVRRYDVETCAEVHLEAIQKAVAHKVNGGRP